jgi:hypothetical protein
MLISFPLKTNTAVRNRRLASNQLTKLISAQVTPTGLGKS